MALTTSGSVEPQLNPRADAEAQAVYGNPARPDATREPRMQGISDVAAAHTSDGASQFATGGAFIQDNGEAAHQWSRTPGKQNATPINNQGSGFPGLANEPSRG